MKTTLSLLAATLGLTGISHVHAAAVPTDTTTSSTGNGLQELSDEDMADMRGRYTVGQNAVAYFGVSMISTWQSASGQLLEATMQVTIDARNRDRAPTVSFKPTINITSVVPGMRPNPAAGRDSTERHVDGSGLANVSGLTQGVQVAGDGNRAINVTDIQMAQLDESNAPPAAAVQAATAARQFRTMTVGNATVTASAGPEGVRLLLDIARQGSVQQWIRSGSVGQSVQLTSDFQRVSNRMELTVLQQNLASNVQLAQSFAQSLGQIRSAGGMY
jgi:hypothetical protein